MDDRKSGAHRTTETRKTPPLIDRLSRIRTRTLLFSLLGLAVLVAALLVRIVNEWTQDRDG